MRVRKGENIKEIKIFKKSPKVILMVSDIMSVSKKNNLHPTYQIGN